MMIDSQLMQRYVVGQDSLAFRELVARHGPAVLRVCRRFVHDPHAAEDAMQATFLILVQRAPSIRDPDQLDRWLAGVARRVASRARRREIRRTEREQRWAESRSEVSTEAEKPVHIEIRRAIREELGQLSDADRQPLTLCYLDGLTHEEAARQIGCPVGTIKARLVRARRRLRDRLDRRGVSLSLSLLLLLLRRSSPASGAESSTVAGVVLDQPEPSVNVVAKTRWDQVSSPVAVTSLIKWASARKTMLAVVLGLVLVTLGGTAVAARLVSDRSEAKQATVRLMKLLDVSCQTDH